ncbi:MAG: hypothetical protein P8Y54_15225 [Xanthomonadales bacterium]
MNQRTCGPCTACCQGWLSSKKLDMRPGQACRHLAKSGCSIYPDRPEEPCVRFVCGWLQDAETYPDKLRPDRSGVIMLTDRKWHNWDVIRAVPAGREVPRETLPFLRQLAERTGKPVLFYERLESDGEFTGRKRFAFGSRHFAEAVKYAIEPEDVFKM